MVVVAVEMPAERRAEVVVASFCLAGVVSAAARVPSVRAVFEVSVRRNASITRMKKLMRKPEVLSIPSITSAPSNSYLVAGIDTRYSILVPCTIIVVALLASIGVQG